MNPVIVSYSEIFKWDTCQRQHFYRFELGLKPNEESQAITTGSKGHKVLQSFYDLLKAGHSKESALNLTRDRVKKLVSEENVADFGLAVAWVLIENYIKETDFTAETVLVENRFLIPVSKISSDFEEIADVQIGFTPDVVFKRKGDMYDVEDSKFIQKAWSKAKLNRFQQAKLYQIFLRKMGYNVTRSIIRFFNTNTGKNTFQNYVLGAVEEEILINDFLKGVVELIKHKNKSSEDRMETRRTMNYTACQFCAFELPCSLEAEGKSASGVLKHLYKKSDYSYAV